MKTKITFLTILLLNWYFVFSQTIVKETEDLYPDKYTFEKADDFQKKGEYEKAIWFYINLFPDNKNKVVDIVKNLATKLDTIDMDKFIKTSFALYGTFDPTITSFNNGASKLDLSKLNQKGAWGDELIQLISDPNEQLTSSLEYNLRGLDKAKSGDIKGAIDDFNKAISIEPTGEIYYNRANAKSIDGDFEGAIPDYDKIIELKYKLDDAYFERGYCKQEIDNITGAIDDYTKAIEINKDFAIALNNRGTLLARRKDYKAALKDFNQVVKLIPDQAESYVSRGIVKKELGDKTGACIDWKKASELGNTHVNKFIRENCN
jgi:tetratricopeptide (TPR) repeat protein